MKSIDIFYQGENIAGVEHLEVSGEATFGELQARLASQHGLPADVLIFMEGDEPPIEHKVLIAARSGDRGVTVHVHRCRHVNVAVTFNNTTKEHLFSPASTVGHVKQWMAVHKFEMTKDDASEHLLQLAGSTTRPSPSTHIGGLTDGKTCAVAFDLVADERVNGGTLKTA
jgi:hypothetical protein